MIYNADSLMPFGKHKDKKLKDVPADYLVNYLYNIKGLEHGLRNYIDDNMSELTKKLSQSKTHRTQKNTPRKHTSETLTNFFKPFEEMDDKEKIDYLLTENKMLQALKTETNRDIIKLREKFFNECTNYNQMRPSFPSVDMTPHNVFEWIKKNCLK